MKNEKIIKQFEKLIAFVKNEIDKNKSNNDKKSETQNNFRLRQFSKVLSILKKFDKTITLKNLEELNELPGIGKGTIDRISEILKTGELKELKNFKYDNKKKDKALSNLEKVIGIGRTKALEFHKMGITSVTDLKNKIKKGTIEVNDKIKLGLKYHNVYKKNIPREEIDLIYKMLTKKVNYLNKTNDLPNNKKYCFEICGSYRRQKQVSNDIDVLFTKFGSKKSNSHLSKFIKLLKKDDKPFLVDDLTDKEIKTKYMGFCKYKDNPVRRIDIRFVPYESYHSALLYFTGSSTLNKEMRQIAKSKGYKLSEYGLFDLKTGEKVLTKSEKDIFNKLNMDYIEPKFR